MNALRWKRHVIRRFCSAARHGMVSGLPASFPGDIRRRGERLVMTERVAEIRPDQLSNGTQVRQLGGSSISRSTAAGATFRAA